MTYHSLQTKEHDGFNKIFMRTYFGLGIMPDRKTQQCQLDLNTIILLGIVCLEKCDVRREMYSKDRINST